MKQLQVSFCKDDDTVLAFFPTLELPENCIMSYTHIGQHGAASLEYYQSLETADPEEYKELLEELIKIYTTDKSGLSETEDELVELLVMDAKHTVDIFRS
jgi:DNA-directed RNA polymerase subunit F